MKNEHFFKSLVYKAAAFLPAKLRYPPVYWRMRDFLRKAQYWQKDRIIEWQTDKLVEIINYAYENTNGYKKLFNEAGITPNDIKKPADVRKLPFVTKELIRDNLQDFTSRKINKFFLKYMTTGGSTGIPFGFYNTYSNYFIEHAFIHSAWEWMGWEWGSRSALLRGNFVGSDAHFWHYEKYSNELQLSSYFLNDNTYSNYIKKIEEYKPRYLQAYPSSALILADLIINNNHIGRYNFDTLFLGSENIYNWQLARIKKAFPKSKIHYWYGHAEKVILAPKCEKSGAYQLWPFYGITEILNQNDNEVNTGKRGELCGISFWNYATPFIRYRTKDFAIKGNLQCPERTRNFRTLQNIEGRLQEIIVSSTGRYISMTAINFHDDIFDSLKQFKFEQNTPGELIFYFLPKHKLTNNELDKIKSGIENKLSDDFTLFMSESDEIKRNKAGKYSFLEQKLDIKYGDR